MLDEIKILVSAGNGGMGIVSFHRERYVPRGGPDGGDGGLGGDVIVVADESLLVLDKLRRRRHVKAGSGGSGGPDKRHGKNGEAAIIRVPVGTLIWSAVGGKKQLADLAAPGMRVRVARGGSGGRGNARMATAIRRAPRIAERGTKGGSRRLRLELRLLAEMGLIGLPNAGKSSLLRAMSKATPKVGDYPFTTLEPNLGVMERDYETLVAADIPGLIEGAHDGAGLGGTFLRHIRRTRLLVHVVDVSRTKAMEDIRIVRRELEAFGEGLGSKRWIVALNKIDLTEGEQRLEERRRELQTNDIESYAVSAHTGAGVDDLIAAIFKEVKSLRGETVVEKQTELLDLARPQTPLSVRAVGNGYVVRGERPRRAAEQLGVDSEEARAELARRLGRMGAIAALRRAGVKAGDRVRIGREELVWPL